MPDPWLVALVAKMVTAAIVVVTASVIAERSGPFIAAMVATLPVSAGPVYVFLALEHDASFISAAALGSMGSNIAAAFYCVAYVFMAQRAGAVASIASALAAWFISVIVLKQTALPVGWTVVLMIVLFSAGTILTRPYLSAKPLMETSRAWYAIPVRALSVALLVAVVTSISAGVGPVWSGMLATFPIVLSSLAAILHPRIGGPATAAALANAIPGLFGFGIALAFVHLSAISLGSAISLSLGLAICIMWNVLLVWRARQAGQA